MENLWSEDDDGALSQAVDREAFAAYIAAVCNSQRLPATALRGGKAADLVTAVLWRRLMLQAGAATAVSLPALEAGAAAGSVVVLGHAPAAEGVSRFCCPPQDTFSPLQQKVACDAVWLWELAGAPTGLAWLAALGCVDKAGRAPVSWLRQVQHRHTSKFLRITAALLDVAVRAPPVVGAVDLALEVLHAVDGPRAFAAHPRVALLAGLLVELEEAERQAQKTEPYLCGRLAVYQINSRFCIEDRLAAAWAKHLRPRVVLVGNRFDAEKVRFQTCSSCRMQAMDYLRGAGWPEKQQVPNATVTLDVWHLLLRRLHVAV